MSVKEKLLEAVGDIDICDIGEEALVGILVNKITALEEDIKRLNGANAHERLMLDSQQRLIQEERQMMRRNPLYGAEGNYFFLGRKTSRFHIHVTGSIIELSEREKRIDFRLQQISPQQWEME